MHQPGDDHDLPVICGITLTPLEVPMDAQDSAFANEVGKTEVSSDSSKCDGRSQDDRKEAAKAKKSSGVRSAWQKKWISARKKRGTESTAPTSTEGSGRHFHHIEQIHYYGSTARSDAGT